MTSSDPECRLLAGGDLKLTDVRLDHFSSDGPHSASPRQPPSFEAVGVTRQTRGGGERRPVGFIPTGNRCNLFPFIDSP